MRTSCCRVSQALRSAYADFGNKPLTVIGPPFSNPNYAGGFGQVRIAPHSKTNVPGSPDSSFSARQHARTRPGAAA